MLFRLLYSLIYSLLLFSLSGVTSTAQAVVSCQDLISTGSTYRYVNALSLFTEYNGKTYAITKSAISGKQSLPDSYFNLSADISREHMLTGIDTASLKKMLSLGKFGAAKPVSIDSQKTLDFVLNRFGKYLGAAATAKSTYIDVWKEFGTTGFTALDGSSLAFTNWPASGPYTGNDPQAVVMGSDGIWKSGVNGSRSSQIVEFPGKLDCAVSITPPQPGSITPPPSGSAGTDLAKPVCGQDLNNNGYAADPGEIDNCTQTPQGQFCPVGAVNCVESYSAPVCQSGSVLNVGRDMCQADATVTCGSGYVYDASIDKCVEQVSCPDGGTFNPVTDQCEKLVLNQCPVGYSYVSTLDVCRMSAGCSGGTFNPTKDRCETLPSWNCPTGFTYNGTTLRCEASPYCPPGTAYNTSRDRCEAAVGSCAAGYSYNAVLNKCTVAVNCPAGGSLNGTTDKCELASSIVCTTGTTYNAATGKCEKVPSCAAPGTYNAINDLCLTPSSGAACPTGYIYNSSYGACISSPSCVGGTYSNATNRCEAAPSYSCPDSSYSYNFSVGRCEKAPVCSQGTYNSTYNVCLQSITPSCQSGYSYNSTTGRCEMSPVCSQGTFNSSSNQCEWTTVYAYDATSNCPSRQWYKVIIDTYDICTDSCLSGTCSPGASAVTVGSAPVGGIYSGRGRYGVPVGRWCKGYTYNYYFIDPPCTYSCPSGGTLVGTTCTITTVNKSNPICPNGSFDYGAHVCYAAYTPTCPTGTAYDSSIGSCTVAPTCSNGLLDGNRDVCYQSANAGCLSGYTLSGSICTATPFCASGGSLDGSIDFCKAAATWNCPAGYSYSATYGKCYQAANCGSGSLNLSLDVCQQSYSLTCPSGYTLNGTSCQLTPACAAGGSYNSALDLCDGGSNVCTSPLTLDTGVDQCYQAASCSSGTLSGVTDKCEAAASVNCGAFNWDSPAQVCYSPPVCNQGAYDATANECRATVTRNCGTYSWSATEAKCTRQIICPKDAGYLLSNTVAYSPTLDKCSSAAQHTCPTGTTYNGLPISKCEAVPICSGAGIYNSQKDSCFEGLNTCPLGTQYACMDYQGEMRCSQNSCFDPSTPGAEVTTTLDESMLQDDGPKDADGKCLGQIYIFNGKASRCRLPGMKVGYLNNCCESDDVAAEDTGSNAQYVSQGIQTAYEVGQVAYYGEALATGAAEISAISTSATGAVTSMTVVTAGGTTTTLSGAAATGAYASMASGTTGMSALASGLEAYVGALLNPTTIIIAVVVIIVMKVLMGSGCDQGDIQAGMQVAGKNCHYLGDYCEKKWSAVGCVQKAKSYCCFNSKMARIIHEQGRPQLHAFQPDGAWGTPAQPNCRGFSPDEFQALDFSKIDLSEYFDDVQKDLATKIQGSQQTIMENIQNKNQATQR